MKNLIVTLCLVAPSLSFATTTSVDNSRGASEGVVVITISGGKGSQAEKLYNSLTQVAEQPDDAMGGRHGTAKQAKAIDCYLENDSHVKNAYQCLIEVSTAGDSLEPWR
ncbi:MAG: hypothetical protein ACXVA9_07140 [Bdellovibrionales bacterium]